MYLFGTLFTIPSATSSYALIAEWSSPLFTDLWPVIILVLAIVVPILVMKVILSLGKH